MADEWWITWGERTEECRALAQRVLRCQTRTFNVSHHKLDFAGDNIRKHALHCVQNRRIFNPLVRCELCGWQAFLSDWEKSMLIPPHLREKAAVAVETKHPTLNAQFVRPCGGIYSFNGAVEFLRDSYPEVDITNG